MTEHRTKEHITVITEACQAGLDSLKDPLTTRS